MITVTQKPAIFQAIKQIPVRDSIQIQLIVNENPYKTMEFKRVVLDEPLYELTIRVKDVYEPMSPIFLYDYFDAENRDEIHNYIQMIEKELKRIGHQQVKVKYSLQKKTTFIKCESQK